MDMDHAMRQFYISAALGGSFAPGLHPKDLEFLKDAVAAAKPASVAFAAPGAPAPPPVLRVSFAGTIPIKGHPSVTKKMADAVISGAYFDLSLYALHTTASAAALAIASAQSDPALIWDEKSGSLKSAGPTAKRNAISDIPTWFGAFLTVRAILQSHSKPLHTGAPPRSAPHTPPVVLLTSRVALVRVTLLSRRAKTRARGRRTGRRVRRRLCASGEHYAGEYGESAHALRRRSNAESRIRRAGSSDHRI